MFHGNGHEIRNMVSTNSPLSPCRGLLGKTSGATLDGITVSGMVTASQYVGGLVGGIENGVFEIRDGVSFAEVVAGEYTGGFIGYVGADRVEISGCRADGYPVDPATGLCEPLLGPSASHMFFRYRICLDGE